MTALPNHTCFKVIESYGIETPWGVLEVDVVEFDKKMEGVRPRYNTHGVMVNGRWNKNLVELANISGHWNHIATSKADALRVPVALQDKAEQIEQLFAAIRDPKQAQRLGKNISAYNHACDYFLSFGVSYRRKIEWIIKGNTWAFVREGKNVFSK